MKSTLILFSIIGLIFLSDINPASAVTIDTSVVIKKTIRYSRDSIEWNVAHNETFDYNGYGFLTLHYGIGKTGIQENSDYVGEDTLYYDENNRVIEEHIRSNTLYFHIRKNEYSKDDKLIKQVIYSYLRDTPKPESISMKLYVYENDNLSFKYLYNTDSVTVEPINRTSYVYSNNQLHFEILQFKKDLTWVDSVKTTYEYTKTGKYSLVYDNNHTLDTKYKYDPISDLLIHFNGLYNNWAVVDETYKYNSMNQIIFEERKSPLGWFKAETFYKNNRIDSVQYWSYEIDPTSWDYISSKCVYSIDLLIQEIQSQYMARSWEQPFKYAIIDYEYRKITDIHDEKAVICNINISPNPASDFIEISVGANGMSPLQSDVRIFNVLGEIQTTPNPTPALPASEEGVRIDVSGLAPGIYFVWIGDRVGKFVKL